MGRPKRINFPGAIYHIFARGNGKRDIFLDKQDRYRFLRILRDIKKDFKPIIFSYVLMSNHYHIVLQTTEVNLSNFMQKLNNTYSKKFNDKYDRKGYLFEERFKSILAEKGSYLLELTRYVHLNPIRAGLVKKLKDYKWSSYHEYMGSNCLFDICNPSEILAHFGKNKYKALKKYKKYLAEGKNISQETIKEQLVGGYVLGSISFARDMLDKMGLKFREKAIEEPKAKQIISLTAGVFKTSETEIIKNRSQKNFARKSAMYIIRERTSLRLREIGEMFQVKHTAISKAIRVLENDMQKNKSLKNKVKYLLTHKTVPGCSMSIIR